MDEAQRILDPMRMPCKNNSCGAYIGVIRTRNGQDCVFCKECGTYQYNAPKTETGREVRSTQTTHAGIKQKTRARIIARANGRCEFCGKPGSDCATGLHVEHLIPVVYGLNAGLSDAELNHEENLAAFCDECNLGKGFEPVPLRFAVTLFRARMKFRGEAGNAN